MLFLVDAFLSPLYLLQGKKVRKSVITLPEPPGERSGKRGTGKKLKLLIIGDSSAAGVGASHQHTALLGNILQVLTHQFEVHFRLMAKTGARTRNSINRLNRAPEEKFDIAVSALGVNDVTRGISVQEWEADQRELFTLLREKFGVTSIITSLLPPVGEFPALPQPLRWYLGRKAHLFSEKLRHLCKEMQVECVSIDVSGGTEMMARDGFHPGEKVYKIWGSSISDKIIQIKQY